MKLINRYYSTTHVKLKSFEVKDEDDEVIFNLSKNSNVIRIAFNRQEAQLVYEACSKLIRQKQLKWLK